MAFLDDVVGLPELWSLIQSADEEVAESGVKIAKGSYVATNKAGSANPNSLTFDFVPKLIIIHGSGSQGGLGIAIPACLTSNYQDHGLIGVYGSSAIRSYAKMVDKTLSWYHGSGAQQQLNYSSNVYHWIAIR